LQWFNPAPSRVRGTGAGGERAEAAALNRGAAPAQAVINSEMRLAPQQRGR
jgi:hypothetical protein